MKILPLLLLLVSCADLNPYVGYTHLSDPRIENDGYDLLCGGVKYRKAVELSAGACGNVRGGEFFRFDAEYVWDE